MREYIKRNPSFLILALIAGWAILTGCMCGTPPPYRGGNLLKASVEAPLDAEGAWDRAYVQLFDSQGKVAAGPYLWDRSIDNSFTFDNLKEGDYALAIAPGDFQWAQSDLYVPVSAARISILQGDDAEVRAAIAEDRVEYRLTFKSNASDSGLSQSRVAANIAAAAKAPLDTVTSMRASGMAWGGVARSFGVRPDMIGMKYGDGFEEYSSRSLEPPVLRSGGPGGC